MQRFYINEITGDTAYLSEEESVHCIKILRKKQGDIIDLCDGNGYIIKAEIKSESVKKTEIFSLEKTFFQPGPEHRLTLVMAPTKNADRMEWLVEKAVEMGVGAVKFVFCNHSERREFKTDRVIKKAISAMKQSGRAWLPKLEVEGKLRDYLKTLPPNTDKWIAYLDDKQKKHLMQALNPDNETLVLIGPEGDFDSAEIAAAFEAGFKPVHLGLGRLRTETAGLFAVSCFASAIALKA